MISFGSFLSIGKIIPTKFPPLLTLHLWIRLRFHYNPFTTQHTLTISSSLELCHPSRHIHYQFIMQHPKSLKSSSSPGNAFDSHYLIQFQLYLIQSFQTILIYAIGYLFLWVDIRQSTPGPHHLLTELWASPSPHTLSHGDGQSSLPLPVENRHQQSFLTPLRLPAEDQGVSLEIAQPVVLLTT